MKSNATYNFISTILLLAVVASASPHARNTTADDVPPNFDVESGRILFGIGFCFTPLNFFGSAYVLLRTYLRWRNTGQLSMALRLPFYIALTGEALTCV